MKCNLTEDKERRTHFVMIKSKKITPTKIVSNLKGIIMVLEDNRVRRTNRVNELRPYIESDGGYLEFVEIDYTKNGPIVKVRLHGACSSCPMSDQKDYENGYRETYSDDISRGL